MLRFDGVVFLLGTAISAPVSLQNKDADLMSRHALRASRPLHMAARESACERALYRFRAQLQGEGARPRLQVETKRTGRVMILPITLSAAGAAALINFWLAMRVGRVRTTDKISMGDGGNERLIAAMRAQSNFVEYTPFVLILVALIEMATGTSTWLWVVSAVFLLGRLAHGLGMTDQLPKGRMIGTIITFLTLLGLGLYAIAVPYLTIGTVTTTEMVDIN
jgi:uncharacterized protein